MAILRGGKRFGVFDIRIGLPRDRSLDTVEKDAKQIQGSNPQSTINVFRAQVAQSGGYARENRFVVSLTPPPSFLSPLVKKEILNDAIQNGELIGSPTQSDLDSFFKNRQIQFQLNCYKVSMPDKSIDVQNQSHYYGPDKPVATGTKYENVTLGFYLDKYHSERTFFEMWENLISNPITYNLNYPNEYTASRLEISQLGAYAELGTTGSKGTIAREAPTQVVRLIDVFPVSIGTVDYNYGNKDILKFDVTFAYRYWATDVTVGYYNIPDGRGDITSAGVVKSAPGIGGLLGKLPPEIRRAATGVFNQIKTQIPVGRIFKSIGVQTGGIGIPPFLG